MWARYAQIKERPMDELSPAALIEWLEGRARGENAPRGYQLSADAIRTLMEEKVHLEILLENKGQEHADEIARTYGTGGGK
jgi:hypothetical protein